MNKKNKLIEDEFTDASKFDFSTSVFICRKNGMNQNLTLQYFLYYFFPNGNVCDIYSVMFVAPKLKRKKNDLDLHLQASFSAAPLLLQLWLFNYFREKKTWIFG